ncbi:hypothetical protein DL93DRAFT_2170510 [Clavulina sp. PMI_390]|nr:hypothetical protein DL93DRAFT_2170510 [Clavulina sp. PMI_390]
MLRHFILTLVASHRGTEPPVHFLDRNRVMANDVHTRQALGSGSGTDALQDTRIEEAEASISGKPPTGSVASSSQPSSLPENGLHGRLRLTRPDFYDPRCIVVVVTSVRRANGVFKVPKVVSTVIRVRRHFLKYGPITYVIDHQGINADSRDYYITFESPAAAKVARSALQQDPWYGPLLRHKDPSEESIPLSYGVWLALFSQDEAALPEESEYLASTHPWDPSATLRLTQAECKPIVEPVPRATNAQAHATPKALQTTSQPHKPSIGRKRASRKIQWQALELLNSVMPTSQSSNLDISDSSRQLTEIEFSLTHDPILAQDSQILTVLAKISHIPDSIIPGGDRYSIRQRCRRILELSTSVSSPDTPSSPDVQGRSAAIPTTMGGEVLPNQPSDPIDSFSLTNHHEHETSTATGASPNQHSSTKRDRDDQSESRDGPVAKRPKH